MESKQKAMLALEDGAVFEGGSFGFLGEKAGEIVFNTSMTGYQEILTDPSHKSQIVTMTYPHIGNYGMNEEDIESQGPKVEGFIIKENSSIFHNIPCVTTLSGAEAVINAIESLKRGMSVKSVQEYHRSISPSSSLLKKPLTAYPTIV